MKKIVFKYVAYAMLTGMVAFGFSLFLGALEVLGYTAIFVALSFVFFGVKYYRDTENAGKISFTKAFIIGISIALFTALGIAIVDGLYVTVIHPDFYQEYGEAALVAAQETGDAVKITDAETQLKEFNAMSLMQLGFFSGGFMFALVSVIGLIITIISGLILQRK
ncbi:DUF4199 domain-containing protein [uncultured Dokdonia sp.]|uniref:DUF4199 domain-containing protein n=1 Tax=uncultured Dokdonia sp. TaxID=575653 RepID=UPI002601B2D2|nr:DUF4199 domain-containing protein [uncultured Dokdonia sp.]